MIFKGKKELTEINLGKKNIIEIYLGKYLMWQAIRSCFGKGYWIPNLPWINTDIWKNNKK